MSAGADVGWERVIARYESHLAAVAAVLDAPDPGDVPRWDPGPELPAAPPDPVQQARIAELEERADVLRDRLSREMGRIGAAFADTSRRRSAAHAYGRPGA